MCDVNVCSQELSEENEGTKINSKLSQETILNFYAQTNDLFSVFLFNYELEYFFNVRFVLVCHIGTFLVNCDFRNRMSTLSICLLEA